MRQNEDKNRNYTTAKMVISQLESLKMIKEGGQEIPHYDYIIIDEITSFIKHFTSSTMKKRQDYTLIISILKELFNNCDKVFVFDADITFNTISFIQRFLPNESIHYTKYEFNRFEKVPYNTLYNEKDLFS